MSADEFLRGKILVYLSKLFYCKKNRYFFTNIRRLRKQSYKKWNSSSDQQKKIKTLVSNKNWHNTKKVSLKKSRKDRKKINDQKERNNQLSLLSRGQKLWCMMRIVILTKICSWKHSHQLTWYNRYTSNLDYNYVCPQTRRHLQLNYSTGTEQQ